jgi:flagellar biosynthesis chaperone FliJ
MPARFHFALAPLLDLRIRVEEEKRRALELARWQRDAALRDRKLLADALTLRVLKREDAGSLAVFDGALAARLRHAESAERDIHAARNDLCAARRDRRAIERLYERRRRAFEREEQRREELEIDETNARRRVQ